MQLTTQLQLQWVTLVDPEARLSANCDAALILIKAQKDDLVGVSWLIRLTVAIALTIEGHCVQGARPRIVRQVCNGCGVLVWLGLRCKTT